MNVGVRHSTELAANQSAENECAVPPEHNPTFHGSEVLWLVLGQSGNW